MSKNRYAQGDTHYFEIKGHPGQIYIEKFSFGASFIQLSNHSRAHVISPIFIHPEWEAPFNPIHWMLEERFNTLRQIQYGKAATPAEYTLPECTIGLESKQNGRAVKRPIYRLLQIKVINIYSRVKQNKYDTYEFEFANYQQL